MLDIDRPDLADALTDARQLVATIQARYGVENPPIWFSGSKGFHVAVELAHEPPPSVGFHRVARAFASTLAARAGVTIDLAIFNVNHIVRLPNTRHPRTGLFKRRVDAVDLLRLGIDEVRRLAEHPAGDGIPSGTAKATQLISDWREAEQQTARVVEARAQQHERQAGSRRAPRYFIDLFRFGVDIGERHTTLFRCAAWLTEQGSPPSLCHALLAEIGCDSGLSPKDVERQIECGIRHTQQQQAVVVPRPEESDDAEIAFERWCIQHESDPLPPGALDFPFGALALKTSEGGPPT